MAERKNLLICVTQQKTCERLIRKADELRKDRNCKLHVLHVVKSDNKFLNNAKEGEALEYLFGIAKSVGANLAVLKSDNVAKAIAEYANDNNIDCIIMGESPKEQRENNFLNELMNYLDDIEVKIVP